MTSRDKFGALKTEAEKTQDQLIRLKDTAQGEAGRTLDDAWITTRVRAALFSAPGLDSLDISVGTELGAVRLSGQLDTMDQVLAAERITAGTPGVRRVHNDLRVKSSAAG